MIARTGAGAIRRVATQWKQEPRDPRSPCGCQDLLLRARRTLASRRVPPVICASNRRRRHSIESKLEKAAIQIPRRAEKDRLSDASQTEKQLAPGVEPRLHPIECDARILDDPFPAGQFGRRSAGTGREGVGSWIHSHLTCL